MFKKGTGFKKWYVFENILIDLPLLPLFWLIAFYILLIYIFVLMNGWYVLELLSVYEKDNHSVLLWQMVNN